MPETSDYPGALDVLTDQEAKRDLASKAIINKIQNCIEAIEAELGTDPAGTQTNVKTLLQRCLATNGAMRQGTGFPGSPNEGDFFYRTDQDIVYVYDGSGWDAQSGITNYATGSYSISGSGLLKFSYTPGTSYVKVDEFYVPRSGTINTKFWLNKVSGGGTSYGRIYVNGSAAGTERTDSGGAFTQYSENITVTAGDLIQVYTKGDDAGNVLNIGGLELFENVPTRETDLTTPRRLLYGTGVPDNGLGNQGDLYLRTDGGATTTLYVKTGASTWTAK